MADRLPELVMGPGSGLSDQGLEFCEYEDANAMRSREHPIDLDRVEIGEYGGRNGNHAPMAFRMAATFGLLGVARVSRTEEDQKTIRGIIFRTQDVALVQGRGRLGFDIEYPSWSSHGFGPFPVIPEQSVCDCDDASHDGGYGESGGFSGGSEGVVSGLEGWIEADCDEGRHRLPRT